MVQSYFELLRSIEEEHGDKTAFSWFDEEKQEIVRKSFCEVASDVRKFIGCLKAENSNCEGEHIGIFARNSYHYVVCVMGIIFAGAVAVPLNVRERQETLRKEIEFADVTRMFAEEAFMNGMREACDPLGISVHEIGEYSAYNGMLEADSAVEMQRPAILVYTSGTSGNNKCVELSQGNVLAGIKHIRIICSNIQELRKGNELKKAFIVLPLFHVVALADTFGHLVDGIEQDLCLNLQNLYRDIGLFNPHHAIAVPVFLEEWERRLNSGDAACLGTISSMVCGGASIDPQTVRTFDEKGILITLGYGMSETFAAGAYNIVNVSKKYNSVGKLPPSIFQVKFEDGELCLKGAPIMTGYYKDPEETAKVLQDGWLHTGDMGYMDEDGYVYLTGRKKNLIILSGGENVSPEELEGLVLKDSDVKEILVKEKDGKICAEIFCDAEKQDAVRKYVADVNRTLPMYKRITLVEFRGEPFKRTASGKIVRG